MDSEDIPNRDESQEAPGVQPGRSLLIIKAAGLLVALAIIGVTLVIVLWILITIIVQIIAAL